MLAVGLLVAGWAAWRAARTRGARLGLLLPALALAGAVARSSWPVGHPEEAMGRGFEVLLFWSPLVGLTWLGAALGLFFRRHSGQGASG